MLSWRRVGRQETGFFSDGVKRRQMDVTVNKRGFGGAASAVDEAFMAAKPPGFA
jgi:hypothetical protein